MTPSYGREAAERSADAIRGRTGNLEPEIGIVLGSGLGGLASDIEDPIRIPFSEVPGFPSATVVGHAGALVCGKLSGRNVVAMAGRFHMYEGHSAQLAGFPVRVMHALGARIYFASNAAGGIRRDLSAGDLMIIEDHINLTSVNPLTGHVEEGDERFPDMSAPYDPELRKLLKASADTVGVETKEGVYACLSGPSLRDTRRSADARASWRGRGGDVDSARSDRRARHGNARGGHELHSQRRVRPYRRTGSSCRRSGSNGSRARRAFRRSFASLSGRSPAK